jgi:hypothetical protein
MRRTTPPEPNERIAAGRGGFESVIRSVQAVRRQRADVRLTRDCGHGFVPLLMPFVGLWWLGRTRTSGVEAVDRG